MEETIYFFECKDIFQFQDVRNELWRICIEKRFTFREICQRCNNDIQQLIQAGMNLNFLTRSRWLDIDVIVNQLHLSFSELRKYFPISQEQFDSWNLTSFEKHQLKI